MPYIYSQEAMLKDYYRILELEPGASAQEIRRSFRRLAMKYHPDKQVESQAAGSMFRELQEAYETLTDPQKKETYLQKRWYEQAMGSRLSGATPKTAFNLHVELLRLDQHLSTMDPFRIDRRSLLNHLKSLLSAECIDVLNQEQDHQLVRQVLQSVITSSRHLRLAEFQELIPLLTQVHPGNSVFADAVRYASLTKMRDSRWRKWKIPVLMLVTVILCVVIYVQTKK